MGNVPCPQEINTPLVSGDDDGDRGGSTVHMEARQKSQNDIDMMGVLLAWRANSRLRVTHDRDVIKTMKHIEDKVEHGEARKSPLIGAEGCRKRRRAIVKQARMPICPL